MNANETDLNAREAEAAKTELMTQVAVEVVKAIQRRIESGPAHEELTHATVLCTELISNLEKAAAGERNFWAQFNRLSEQSEKARLAEGELTEAINMLTNLLDILETTLRVGVGTWQPNEAGHACLVEARRIVKDWKAGSKVTEDIDWTAPCHCPNECPRHPEDTEESQTPLDNMTDEHRRILVALHENGEIPFDERHHCVSTLNELKWKGLADFYERPQQRGFQRWSLTDEGREIVILMFEAKV